MSEYVLTQDDKKFGVPEQKKFPMPDADHVKSAIKFFNYVEPKYEKQLAKAILRRAKEYGVDISEMNIGDNNRFKKYLPNDELKHHGILGQKWGIRRYQNEDGTYTEAGKKRRAKVITKELNNLSKTRSRSVAKLAGINNWRDVERLERKINKQKDKQKNGKDNQAKINKLIDKLNKKKTRISELEDEYIHATNKINKIINNLSNSKDYLYKTSPMYIGNNGNWFSNESYYQTVWGTGYKVKPTTEKRLKSEKWTKRHNQYAITPVRTNYYYY